MKVNGKLISSALMLGAVTFSSCTLQKMIKMSQQQQLNAEPSPLELHGDSVKFTLSANLPKKMLKKNTSYSIKTLYKYGTPTKGEKDEEVYPGSLDVQTTTFDASLFPNSKVEESKIEETLSFGYTPEFEFGQLFIEGTATKKGKTKSAGEVSLKTINGQGMGIITTSRLAQPTFGYANYLPHDFTWEPEYENRAIDDFYFQQGKAKLEMKRSGINNQESADSLKRFITAENKAKAITIVSSHSPEGTEAINTDLASQRGEAIKAYYTQIVEEAGFDVEKLNFVQKPVVLDWAPFKKALAEYEGISDDAKNEILAIVDGDGEFTAKELRLKKLSSYRKVFANVYPKLRNAQIEIMVEKDKLTEAEIIALGQKIGKGQAEASELKEAELLFSAVKTPDLAEKEAIYKATIAQYDSYKAYNNLGAVYMTKYRKSTDESEKSTLLNNAITQFELALKKKVTAHGYANLAGAKLVKGDLAGALLDVEKASQNNPSGSVATTLNAIKGYANILKGEYEIAISNLASAGNNPVVLYNKALANLLKKDYVRASSGFNEAVSADSKNALAYYCSAITASRKSDEAGMATALTNAVKLDAKLKEKAVKDLEFIKYWESEAFKGALK